MTPYILRPLTSWNDLEAATCPFMMCLSTSDICAGETQLDTDSKALLQLMVPLLRNTRKLKTWLSKRCTVGVASGDELSMYWQRMGMGSAAMPATMPVCKSSDPTMVQLSMCENFCLCKQTLYMACGNACRGLDALGKRRCTSASRFQGWRRT